VKDFFSFEIQLNLVVLSTVFNSLFSQSFLADVAQLILLTFAEVALGDLVEFAD